MLSVEDLGELRLTLAEHQLLAREPKHAGHVVVVTVRAHDHVDVLGCQTEPSQCQGELAVEADVVIAGIDDDGPLSSNQHGRGERQEPEIRVEQHLLLRVDADMALHLVERRFDVAGEEVGDLVADQGEPQDHRLDEDVELVAHVGRLLRCRRMFTGRHRR